MGSRAVRAVRAIRAAVDEYALGLGSAHTPTPVTALALCLSAPVGIYES